jgi:hypothetical protein
MANQTACPECEEVGLVRAERILKGSSVTVSYYCGACEHAWIVVHEERRAPLMATVKPKPDRRRGR